jgi:hypothetical protein
MDTSTDFFWNRDAAVWNNNPGDTATLADNFGNKISIFTY